jgi:hypothetical protein
MGCRLGEIRRCHPQRLLALSPPASSHCHRTILPQFVLSPQAARLRAADPLLLHPKPLGNIESHSRQIREAIAGFRSTRDRGNLETANSHSDSILASAAQLALAAAPDQSESVDAVKIVRQRSEELLRALTKEEGRIRDQVTKLQVDVQSTVQEVTSQKGRLDKAIAEYQQQFSSAESARQSQATEALNTHSQRLDQTLTEAQKRLQESFQQADKRLDGAVTEGQAKLQNLLKSANDRTDSTLKEAADKASAQHASQQQSGQAVIDQLEDFREKAENLLHVIGSTGMAGEYQKVADSARLATFRWQVIATFSMLVLVAFAAWTFFDTQGGDIQWGAVVGRAFVVVTAGVLAAYAVRQSDRYSEIEIANRRYQLELSSIDPYLANLPEQDQQKVKLQLAEKLFGNASRAVPAASAEEFSGTLKEPLLMTLTIIREVMKKRL